MHREVLSDVQNSVFDQLLAAPCMEPFYLAGGTAIALLFGHRMSEDFDWFIENDLENPLLFASQLRASNIEVVTQHVTDGTLHCLIQNVRVSFIRYRYPLLSPTTGFGSGYGSITSLDDLACMKLAAIVQRGSRKDFIDICVLLQEHKPLGELLQLFKVKYHVNDVVSILYALTYFDDAEREVMPKMVWDSTWDSIKKQISTAVRQVQ